ncbi:hypothetical protein SLE2022_080900 [Rubroshorea leprosula]
MERGWRHNVEISPNCPRCGSSNTKFCYYNNYSLTQPRYFCKGCRRYWTKGGSLRNVPVGGGCRKNRRGKALRIPGTSEGVPPRTSMGCGVVLKDSTECHSHSYPLAAAEQCTSTSGMSDGSHIDLAAVYANFLNHQPEKGDNNNGVAVAGSCTGLEIPELPNEFDPSMEFSPLPLSVLPLSEEQNGLGGCISVSSNMSVDNYLSSNDRMYYSGLEPSSETSKPNCEDHHRGKHTGSTYGHETYRTCGELPPLSGEDHGMLWSNSHPESMLNLATQDPNLLFGNWSPFDLSSDDTFPKS